PYLGIALAGPITWFNIVFLPGIFGFLVWELKENWRLYAANRRPHLSPVPVGSHGETIARLMRLGLHSGTLPKRFRQMRRLEQKDASFRRFSLRRAAGEQLEHVERDVQRFVERELLALLQHHPMWQEAQLVCSKIEAASNSLQIEIRAERLGRQPVVLLMQEQSGWIVSTVYDDGWLRYASADQLRSFEKALEGFYRKAGVELVREQMEMRLLNHHPYDINEHGLTIWPDGRFDREVSVDLHRRGTVRPVPISEAAVHNLHSLAREQVVFGDSKTLWTQWEEAWRVPPDAPPGELAAAFTERSRHALIRHPGQDSANGRSAQGSV
ncbi:MAG: hypothetical protein KDA96_27905, partial [Planctomycetaceae bacterium]|nr:hypothetical protein [Planctomycetaceae bacterium]